MIISVEINNQKFRIDTNEPLDISIPLAFGGAQPNVYGVERASAKPCEAGDLIGDTRRGGSVNFEQVKFIPHCNGTHTECVGHITRKRISIRDSLKDAFILATLVSVEPENALETDETYSLDLSETDELITRKALENALHLVRTRSGSDVVKPETSAEIKNPPANAGGIDSLIIRTLPNDESKKSRAYSDENVPPFFSIEAMRFIVEQGVKHLLVDLPSIDRIFDGGKLTNHRMFWNVEQGAFETNEKSRINNTITELIFAADAIADGNYLLNLQIAPFVSDAAPSRPVLFRLI